MRRPIVALAITALLVGCSRQDFTRPTVHNPLTDTLDSRRPYVKPAKSAAQLRMERFARVLAAQRSRPRTTAVDYRIGPSDVLDISVFALEEPGKTATLRRTVSVSGHMTLPWIGKVTATGKTVRGLEEEIGGAYAGKYLADPQVTITVVEHRSVAVTVGGAVNKPGVYYLTRNSSTALELLALAGGPAEDAGDVLLVVRGRNSVGGAGPAEPGEHEAPEATADAEGVVTIDMKQLVDQGDLDVNLTVSNGDIITVPPRAKAFVYVLGYVRTPGAYELKDGMQIDALRAVALGGGLSSAARASNSMLIRETPKGQKIIPLDLIKIARGIRPPVYLVSGDTLVVGSSLSARVGEYLSPRATVGATAGF